ncbi:fructosamine kinase family protein [Vibrio sinaloensis]|nr:fructosamine kinase family protein [Vibrio sinaloensis]
MMTKKQLLVWSAIGPLASVGGTKKEYGFDQDNYIGSTLQPNKWDRKMGPFLCRTTHWLAITIGQRKKGVNLVDINDFIQVVHDRLASHQPTPSLLHGDLWHGNVANSVFGPICYDPACYWGDRECDIAMTELFEGFQPEFYQGYESVLPLDF